MVRILTRFDKECRLIDHRLFPVLANVILDKLGVKQYPADSGVFLCMNQQFAKYNLGQIVRHRKHPFRGVVFDVDAEFANTARQNYDNSRQYIADDRMLKNVPWDTPEAYEAIKRSDAFNDNVDQGLAAQWRGSYR